MDSMEMKICAAFAVATIALFPFGDVNAAATNIPVVRACVNNNNPSTPCSASERYSTARKAGMLAADLDSESPATVYVFNAADGLISAYEVRNRVEIINGEDRISVIVNSLTPDSQISSEIRTAYAYIDSLLKDGVDVTTLSWDFQNERPVTSAHDLATNQTARDMLMQVVSRSVSDSVLATRIAAETANNLLGIPGDKAVTLTFPDGTSVQIRLVAILDDNDAGLSFLVEVVPGTLKDGNVTIPTNPRGFGNIYIENLQGDQLERFLETARNLGIPITNGGGTGGLRCRFNEPELVCSGRPKPQ